MAVNKHSEPPAAPLFVVNLITESFGKGRHIPHFSAVIEASLQLIQVTQSILPRIKDFCRLAPWSIDPVKDAGIGSLVFQSHDESCLQDDSVGG